MKPFKISQQLPPSVRNALVKASQVNPGAAISRERIAAINAASEDARRMYPHLFRSQAD